jgi:hypothetical protein
MGKVGMRSGEGRGGERVERDRRVGRRLRGLRCRDGKMGRG